MARQTRKKRKTASKKAKKIYSIPIEHFESLGISTPADYREWCLQNGFSTSLNKSYEDRKKEILHYRSKKAVKSLKKRRKNRNLSNVLIAIFNNELSDSDLYTHPFYHIADQYKKCKDKRKFRLLFSKVLEKTQMLKRSKRYIEALCRLVEYSWIRDVQDWEPNSHNCDKQFSHLVRYLFANYDVPLFMDKVWFTSTGFYSCLENHPDWFIHIGQGKNIRTAEGLPFPLTKKAAHFFLQAPKDYTLMDAFLWANVHSLGGSQRETEALRGSKIAYGFKNYIFWQSVIRFFLNNPMLDTNQYGPLVDYINNHKFESQREFIDGRWKQVPPPQPNFSMQRRNAESLINQMEAWHVRLGKENKFKETNWEPCGIDGFNLEEGNPNKPETVRIWEIHEILSKKELVSEGRQMRHCVSSYVGSCVAGRCSIWSLTKQTYAGKERVATIEVRNRQVAQARGYMNAKIDKKAQQIINKWSNQASLGIPGYVWDRVI
jgi:hypothetical protein